MKKPLALCCIGLAAASAAAQAQEFGRVISSTPVIQQVAVPRQVCTQQPVAVEQPNSGAGGLMGAIAGGAMGNAIGDGNGRALATIAGIVGGAMLGNRIEGSGQQVQNFQQCSTQTFYENRAVGYNVTYEYAGKQYTVQMPQDPGPSVRLQITPMGGGSISSAPPMDGYAAGGMPAPQAAIPAVVAPAPMQTIVTVPAPVVYHSYPAYHYRPYYPPLSLHFGYVRGGHGHRHHHWR